MARGIGSVPSWLVVATTEYRHARPLLLHQVTRVRFALAGRGLQVDLGDPAIRNGRWTQQPLEYSREVSAIARATRQDLLGRA